MALSDLYKTIINLNNKRTSDLFCTHLDNISLCKENNERFKRIFCFTGMYSYAYFAGHLSKDEYSTIRKQFADYVNKFEKA